MIRYLKRLYDHPLGRALYLLQVFGLVLLLTR